MHAIQITQLRAFVAVAALGSYTKAAESLGYSEPAVHLQVTALRRALGGALFERRHGQIRLTRFGERMLPLAEHVVRSLDLLVDEADRHHAGEGQALVIGVGRSSGSYVMPAIAGLFRQVYPAVDVSVRMIPVTSIVGELIEGTIDIGFSGGLTEAVAGGRLRGPRVVAVPWSRYGWTFVAAPAYLAGRGPRQETPLPVYLPAFGEPLQIRLIAGFRALGVTPQFATVENSEAAKTAAQALLGVACIPVYAARLELATGELVRCLEEIIFPPAFIEFAHRRPAENPMVATFVTFLRALRTHPSVRQILFPTGGTGAAATAARHEASLRR
jgi:DNA-binding transcriptional LysR family regulator